MIRTHGSSCLLQKPRFLLLLKHPATDPTAHASAASILSALHQWRLAVIGSVPSWLLRRPLVRLTRSSRRRPLFITRPPVPARSSIAIADRMVSRRDPQPLALQFWARSHDDIEHVWSDRWSSKNCSSLERSLLPRPEGDRGVLVWESRYDIILPSLTPIYYDAYQPISLWGPSCWATWDSFIRWPALFSIMALIIALDSHRRLAVSECAWRQML